MNWLSRLTGGGAAHRQRAESPLVRVTDQPFRASRQGRASASFEGQRQHINTAIRQGGELLRQRSRFFCRENPLAISAKELRTAYAVGCGMMPMPVGLSAARKKALLKAFYDWCKICDADGVLDFFGLQATVCDEEFEAGEVFIRLIRSVDQPLKLRLMTSEQLPYSVLSAPDKPLTHTIRLGIETDEEDRRVAYHFYRYHPGDGTATTADRVRTVRIPAEDILHVFKPRQPGQLRGLPRTLGALVPANKLSDYDDTTLERAISGSKVSGIIKKGSTDRGTESGVMAGAKSNGDGTATLDFETGTILELEQDEDWVTVAPPDPGANYGEFTYRNSSQACAAMGVPYLEVTGDLRKATFSAGRLGRMPFKRRVEQFQHLQLSPQMLQPIWMAWLRDGLLRGTITLPRGAARTVEAYSNVRWMGPKWEYIEPLKDRQAEKLAVDELFVPRSDIIAEHGEDPDEIDQKIAEDQRREKRLKLQRRTANGAPAAEADDDEDPVDDDQEGPAQ